MSARHGNRSSSVYSAHCTKLSRFNGISRTIAIRCSSKTRFFFDLLANGSERSECRAWLVKFSDDPMVNTDFPVKRYTAVQYTQPAAAISPLSKSTRHLLVPEPDPRYYYTHRAHQETITIDRDNLKHGKNRSRNSILRRFAPIFHPMLCTRSDHRGYEIQSPSRHLTFRFKTNLRVPPLNFILSNLP